MLILASNSPRRRQLLSLAGWAFTSLPADIDERPLAVEDPRAYVLRLAQAKALSTLSSFEKTASSNSPAVIVAADTTVEVDGQILSKPEDATEAEQMLLRMRGRKHQVHTGLAVLELANRRMRTEVVTTEVQMRAYSDDEIGAYIASGDPMDKAGAYAIQHREFHPVEGVLGCYANVIGLPLCHLTRLLGEILIPPVVPPQAACAGLTGEVCAIYDRI
jgi:septum formation protein